MISLATIDVSIRARSLRPRHTSPSEPEFDGELHDARVECCRNRPETGGSELRRRWAEIDGVQQIEHFETELDRQGRVLVPGNLRAFAGLEGEALVLGSRDHAEIWAPGRWETYSQALEGEAFTDAIAGLGI